MMKISCLIVFKVAFSMIVLAVHSAGCIDLRQEMFELQIIITPWCDAGGDQAMCPPFHMY